MKGDDRWIDYTDKNGESQSFLFNGSNASEAPENQFVSDFISSYQYDVDSVGQALKYVEKSKDYVIYVQKAAHDFIKINLKRCWIL